MNEQAQNRLALIIEQMKVVESIIEDMKQRDQMAWVGVMNNIRSPVQVPAEDAVQVQQAMEAAYKACRTGSVISFSEPWNVIPYK